jgi:hypothetical protein
MAATSNFIHNKNKKMVWMPYTSGNSENLANIGRIANVGTYDNGKNTYDLCDTIIIQPGFYFKEIHKKQLPEKTEQGLMENETFETMLQNRVVIQNGNSYIPQDGGKLTDTVIGFQIEFDGGLYTGRIDDYTKSDGSKLSLAMMADPSLKAERFATTVKTFYPLIYNTPITFGMYTGGPNEQGYTAGIIDGNKANNNRHSHQNHLTYLDYIDYLAGINVREHGTMYKDFWAKLGATNYNYETKTYNGALIFDIVKGLLSNDWSEEAQSYFKDLLKYNESALIKN